MSTKWKAPRGVRLYSVENGWHATCGCRGVLLVRAGRSPYTAVESLRAQVRRVLMLAAVERYKLEVNMTGATYTFRGRKVMGYEAQIVFTPRHSGLVCGQGPTVGAATAQCLGRLKRWAATARARQIGGRG